MSTRDARSVYQNPSSVGAETVPLPPGGPPLSRTVAWLRHTPLWALLSVVGVGAFQILAMASTLLRSKIVALSLGPAGIGAVALLDQIVVLGGQVCMFGMTAAATKFLSAAHSDGDEAFGHAYWTFLRLVLVLSSIGALGTALFLQFRTLPFDMTRFALVVALAIVPVNGIAVIQNAMAASRRARAAATYGLVSTVLVCCVSAAATAFYGLRGYYVGTLCALIATLLVGVWRMRAVQNGGPWFRNPIPGMRHYQTALASAWVLYASSLSAPLADFVPRYVMTRAHTLEATGLLQAAMGMAFAVRTLVRPSLALFLTPTLNRRTPPVEKLRHAASFMRVMLTLTTLVALVIVLFPESALSALYTRKFVAVAPWLYLFLIAIAIQLVGSVYTQMLFALEELRPFVLIAVGGDILTCVTTALLVPTFGIPAVAIGLMADGLVLCVASGWLLRRRHGLNLARAAGPLPSVALALIVAAALALPPAPLTVSSAAGRLALWVAASVALLALLRRASGGNIETAFATAAPGTESRSVHTLERD